MSTIHPSAIVDSNAKLAEGVVIGPFCIVGPNVTIGKDTVLTSHVVIEGHTSLGERNRIQPGCHLGCRPQDLKYADEETTLIVGDDNMIHQNVTMSIGTTQDQGITRVGSNNLFMVGSHVAHDCIVGDHIILANNVALAGHVQVEDHAIVAGQSGVHQFVRIGTYAMVGAMCVALRDVPPYVICSGNTAEPHGLNTVGMRRAGFSDDDMRALKQCYKYLYRENLLVKEAIEKMNALATEMPQCRARIEHFAEFVANSPRGIIR